jgi:fimbrial chaperone protein
MGMFRGTLLLIILIAFVFIHPQPGLSSDFEITPVRLFLAPGEKAGLVKIKNNSASKFPVQLSIFEWTQDAEGKDVYNPTKELIIFPKIVTLDKGVERIIRVGTKVPVSAKEKTFRMYMEELPLPDPADSASNLKIRTVMKVGVPIFIAPARPEPKGALKDIKLEKGVLSALLENSGNVHFLILRARASGLDQAGAAVFQMDLGGRYILAGGSREFTLTIPEEGCKKSGSVLMEVVTDKLTFSQRIDVSPGMCSP